MSAAALRQAARATLQTTQRVQTLCCFCGATPARNESIYIWPEALGLQLCYACSEHEIENAHPEYLAALHRDKRSASGDTGAVVAWLCTDIGFGMRRAWCVGKGKREPDFLGNRLIKGNGKGIDKGKDKDTGKGKERMAEIRAEIRAMSRGSGKGNARSRSRSPRRFEDMAQ